MQLLLFVALQGLLVVHHLQTLFLPGYLIGYLIHQKKDAVAPACPSYSAIEKEYAPPPETGAAPLMDWDNVKTLLAQKVSAAKFDSVFK